MSKLTKREVILLNILLLVTIVGVGYLYWIQPLMGRLDTLKNENLMLTTEKSNLDYVVSNKTDIETRLQDAKSSYELAASEFSTDLTNLMITNYAKEAEMEVLSISRGPISNRKITLASAVKETLTYDIQTLLDLVESKSVPEVVSKESVSEFAYQEIEIVLKGDICQCETFVKLVEDKIKTGYITLFSRDESSDVTKVTIAIYSLKPLESNY